MADEPLEVVLVAGYSRSGSTLLARLLAETDGWLAPGELKYFWRRGLLENRLCDCGEACRDCPFWQKVVEAAFGTLGADDMMEVIRLQDRVDRVHRIPALMAHDRGRSLPSDVRDYLSLYERLYRALGDVSGCRVVVDSSKDPSYGHVIALTSAVQLSVVHLVRDPRAVAHSWTRHRHDPGTGREMARQPPWRTALEWDVANATAGWLRRRISRSMRLRYEDLVRDPIESLDRVLEMAGERGSSTLTGHTVRLHGGHAVSGNPMRFQRGPLTIRPDESWRRALSPSWAVGVAALTWPGRAAFGYLGLGAA